MSRRSLRLPVRLFFLLMVTAILAATAVRAEPYVWRNVKVGGGGFIPGIVFSRAEKGLAYARSDMGGAYRWDAAAKTWIPLQDQMAEGSYFGVESIAPDPVDPNVVYMAAGMYRGDPSAILRSRDRGHTWDIVPVSFRMGGNEDGRGLGERLAVDPNDTAILYFGSRHDGLQRSTDHGATWTRVASFPVKGRGVPPAGQPTNGGVSFVVFDPASGGAGAKSQTIVAGVADPGGPHLLRSDDGGESWRAVPGGPPASMLPVKAAIDAAGVLYITYSDGIGPNGVTDGAVCRLDLRTGGWTDITPQKGPDRSKGGYMGISLDRQRPGTLLVASMNRWQPGDTLWRSTDGGKTWRDIGPTSRRDVSDTPFLLWGEKEANLGWWMAALAIDPFDSDSAAYATGATVYATHDLGDADEGKATLWTPWVEGVEQTAVITLSSPPAGPPLLSGFGDISGFVHEDLSVSSKLQFTGPVFANTNTIDYAGIAPNVAVRSGTPPHRGSGEEPTVAFSVDFGRSWRPLTAPRSAVMPDDPAANAGRRRNDPYKDAPIVVSADGSAFMVMTPTPVLTLDRGKSWRASAGLPPYARPVADRVNAKRFYALDFQTGALFTSRDGGLSFERAPTAGPPLGIAADRPTWREQPWPLQATPGKPDDLWFVSGQGLFHSADGGRSFTRASDTLKVEALSFGKAPTGKDYPALFAIGSREGVRAIWRSDDGGASWLRLTGDGYEYGRRFRCLTGDPRVFGRVYVGTDGRGIVYGEPAAPGAP